MGLKISNPAQPSGATIRRNLRDNRACLLFPFSIPQKPGARDEYWQCAGFVDERRVDEICENISVKGGFLSKLFRCKFLKSRAFTLIEIMVVVSVLGVLRMGLRNTVKKVLFDYEAYGALDFCKKIEKAYINAYLVYNQNGDFFTLYTQLVFLVLLSGDFNKFYKYATDILLPENLDPLLPKGIVKGKGDLMNFYRHSDIKEIVCPNGKGDANWKFLVGEAKNKKGLQLN